MALSEQFAAFSRRPELSLRLLEATPLQADGPLTDVERPLAAASYLNFAGLIDALQPWMEHGLERRQERLAERQSKRAATAQAPQTPTSRAAPRNRVPQARPQPGPAPRAATPRIPAPPPVAAPPAVAPAPVAKMQNSHPAEPISPQEAKEQVRLLFNLLRCWRGFASVTYYEEDALVTHYELRFEDFAE
jgi:hypothetical protein